MNGLLRHTGCIHRGMLMSGFKGYFGVLWGNIKSGYTFVANGFSTTYTGTIGLIKSIKL